MPTPALTDLRPMLLNEVRPALAPDGKDWTVEIKYDGYRLMAGVDSQGRVELRSKGGANATLWYPELQSLKALPPDTIVDGEACVLDEFGRADFDRMHRRSLRRRLRPGDDLVVYCIFDLLVLRGEDLRDWPLRRRKRALAKLLSKPPAQTLYVIDIPGKVRWLYERALGLELEGVVAKRVDSGYQAGVRSADWVKVKRPGAVPAGRFSRKAPQG